MSAVEKDEAEIFSKCFHVEKVLSHEIAFADLCSELLILEKDFFEAFAGRSEMKRMQDISHPLRLKELIRGHNLVRWFLGKNGVIFQKGEEIFSQSGAPLLVREKYYFSLSHAAECAVCFVAPFPVGIDVQDVREVGNIAKLSTRFLHRNEAQFLSSLDEREAVSEFVGLWSAREAFAKLMGKSIFSLGNEMDVSACVQKRKSVQEFTTSLGKKINAMQALFAEHFYLSLAWEQN